MNIVYFSHSYRTADADIVKYFGLLLDGEGLIPSLDPPSDNVNSAKLERHLRSTEGMVAILTAREGGLSQHILYEISLCMRARKPLLVFVEDVLPDNILPSRILQRRFSRQALLRQTREHHHSVRSLKMYLGENSLPIYSQSFNRKACLLIGTDSLSPSMKDFIRTTVDDLGYTPLCLNDSPENYLLEQENHELLGCPELAIYLIDSTNFSSHYLYGAVRTSVTPTITFTTNANFKYTPRIPVEYQPRIISLKDLPVVRNKVTEEIRLFEEEFVDLEKREEVQTYTQMLMEKQSSVGCYNSKTRGIYINELVVSKYHAEQVGAQGPGAFANNNNFNQTKNIYKDLDMESLTKDLERLRLKLKEQATETSHDVAVGQVALAEEAARLGNRPEAVSYLLKTGKWVLDIANQIGTSVITDVIKANLG